MNIPKRLYVLQRLQALLSIPMDIQNDMYDLTGKVIRGKSVMGDETPAPSLAILESPRPDFAVYAGDEDMSTLDYLTVMIEGRIDNDATNPGDPAYWFSAAVVERLSWISAENRKTQMPQYPEWFLLGNRITGMEIAPPVVRPPEDKPSAWAFFYLVVRLRIAGDIANQYTSVS